MSTNMQKQLSPWATKDGFLKFSGESWYQSGQDGTVRIGSLLATSEMNHIGSIRFASPGEKIYQGLPVCILSTSGDRKLVVNSPITGIVSEINEELRGHADHLWKKPDQSWIARVIPDQVTARNDASGTRSALFLYAPSETQQKITSEIENVGCRVINVKSIDDAIAKHTENKSNLIFISELSLGPNGPEDVAKLQASCPDLNVVILAKPNSENEHAFKLQNIFYYGAEPLSDRQVVDVLHSAFKKRFSSFSQGSASSLLPKWINRIHITNKFGKAVSVLAFGDVLVNTEGIGARLIKKLLEQAFPIELTHGLCNASPDDTVGRSKIQKEIALADTIIIVQIKDLNMLPGNLHREISRGEEASSSEIRLVKCYIQPESSQDGKQASFDDATADALADIITNEMAQPADETSHKEVG